MTAIYFWIQSPVALAIAKTLVHSLWQSGIVALLLALVLRVWASSRIRYAAGCAALLVIVTVFVGTFIYIAPGQGIAHSPLAVDGASSPRNIDIGIIRTQIEP